MSEKSGAYEKDMKRLQEIVEQLSKGGLQLDEMMKLYEEGVALSAKCRKTLDEYEAKLIVIDRKNGGNADE
jgi:exodeoxyribonuclease VII small subunit